MSMGAGNSFLESIRAARGVASLKAVGVDPEKRDRVASVATQDVSIQAIMQRRMDMGVGNEDDSDGDDDDDEDDWEEDDD
jgi:hypothetical protein